MKSALFVDFDNVYTQLRQLQPAAAERFARQPMEWLRWLVDALPIPPGHDPQARRRLLVRRCYLNPNWYQNYRLAFLRAGFEVSDCPPVTAQGKTSTDIHMVLDIIELLAHETRCDEFIVLSADADFTPVLRKLRRHDRRTTVLAVGFPSAAYQASADLMIDERLFIEQALGLAGDAADALGGGPAAEVAAGVADSAAASAALVAPAMAGEGVAATAALASSAAALPTASAADLTRMAQRLHQWVAQSPVPLAAGPLALRLRREFAPLLEHWSGYGSFKALFRALPMGPLVWLAGSGGRVADPARHALDSLPEGVGAAERAADRAADRGPDAGAERDAEREPLWSGQPAMLALAREVCSLTGAPLLPPALVRHLLDLLCEDLAQQPYEPTDTARRIREQCQQRHGLDVALREVVFLLRGMQLNGHVFGRGQDDVHTLAQRLLSQVLFLCEREQMGLGPDAVALIRQWMGGGWLD